MVESFILNITDVQREGTNYRPHDKFTAGKSPKHVRLRNVKRGIATPKFQRQERKSDPNSSVACEPFTTSSADSHIPKLVPKKKAAEAEKGLTVLPAEKAEAAVVKSAFSRKRKFSDGNNVSSKNAVEQMPRPKQIASRGNYRKAKYRTNVDSSHQKEKKARFEDRLEKDKDYANSWNSYGHSSKIVSLFTGKVDIPENVSRTVEPVSERLFSKKDFGDVEIHKHLVSCLECELKLSQMTLVQQLTIPLVLKGKDLLVKSQTGSGKTLSYALPIVQMLQAVEPKITRKDGAFALIILPTRELALQSYEWFLKLVKPFVRLVPGCFVGGENRHSEKARLRKGVTIVIGTPGRLLDHLTTTESLKDQLKSLKFLVLDEADRLLELGYEKHIASIVNVLDEVSRKAIGDDNIGGASPPPPPSKRQTILLSATLPPGLHQMAGLASRDPLFVDASKEEVVAASDSYSAVDSKSQMLITPSRLKHYFTIVPAKLRLVALTTFFLWKTQTKKNCKILVFLATQDMVDYHHALFSKVIGCEADFTEAVDVGFSDDGCCLPSNDSASDTGAIRFFKLHGNMDQKDRSDVFKQFCLCSSGILISTEVSARGLDMPNVTWTVHYSPPTNPELYVHRVGRTARAGQFGSSLLFVLPLEAGFIQMLNDKGLSLSEIKVSNLLDKLVTKNLKWKTAVERSHHSDYSIRCAQTGQFSTMEAAATHLQKLFELEVSQSKSMHMLACRAYVSWGRSYASIPREMRQVLCFKQLHLGHHAKAMALREAPSFISNKGVKGHIDQVNLNQRHHSSGQGKKFADDNLHFGKTRFRQQLAQQEFRSKADEFESGLDSKVIDSELSTSNGGQVAHHVKRSFPMKKGAKRHKKKLK